MLPVSLLTVLLPLYVLGADERQQHTQGVKGRPANGQPGGRPTGTNLTYVHEVWHPIHFPSGHNEVAVSSVEESEDDHTSGDTSDTGLLARDCSGHCAAATRELNYTRDEVRELLAFESVLEDGTIQRTELTPDENFINYLNQWLTDEQNLAANLSAEKEASHSRRRRAIVGPSTRFPIDDRKFLGKEPFSAAVKLSTGCSGVLIADRYVLTAARCIHTGKRYVTAIRSLNVGLRRARSLRPDEYADDWERALIWIRVARAYLPYAWTTHRKTKNLPLQHDYAVLELKRSPDKPFLNVSVGSSVNVQESSQLHMNAIDSPDDAALYYRFCNVEGETSELLYQQCDGDSDAVGAGIYVRRWDGQHRRWARKVIGVYTGEQAYELNGEAVVNNIAIRITPLKFAQICYWLTGDYNECNG